MSFKENFVWGAATAAYQIEGAADSSQRGASVWDQMTSWPGKIYAGHNGDVACDHYNRLESDLDLMAEIGLKGYRFSISWPRLLPSGTGEVNQQGLDFYNRLVDGLLERNIQPWATMFHWDFPLELYYRGGWLNSESPEWFGEYAQLLADKLGDRVTNWFTFNEPDMFVTLGHSMGIHAPGLKLDAPDIVRIIHHVLKSHGKAAEILRAGNPDAKVGIAPALSVVSPQDENDSELLDLAREQQFGFGDRSDFSFSNGIWNDPVFLGAYPEEYVKQYGQYLPKGWRDDMAGIGCDPDFIAVNIYQAGRRAVRNADGKAAIVWGDDYEAGFPRSNFMWPITPEALYWGPRFLHERYGKPVVITENGLSSHDWVHSDGKVHDTSRLDFMKRYLSELGRAGDDGVDVAGYFHWSLMDNFEWAEGYRHRFGMIHVDYATQKRTVKESAKWYSQCIKSNGDILKNS